MADLKISDLPTDIVTLAAGDKFPVADVSALTANTYCTAQEIKDFVTSDFVFRQLLADYSLTNTTAIQNMFPSPASVTLSSGEYEFECFVVAGNMSATSGNMKFTLTSSDLGTVVWVGTTGIDSTGAAAAQTGTWAIANATPGSNMVAAGTSSAIFARVFGRFTMGLGGTLTPQINLANAASASMFAGSYIKIKRLSDVGVTSKGDWS